MKEPFIKPLNGFQKLRAPQSVSDAALAEINPRKTVAAETRSSQREQTVHDWLNDFKFGREYDALCSVLSDDSIKETAYLLQQRLREMYGEAAYTDPQNLENAYVSCLDEGLLDRFEAEAAKNAEHQPRVEVVEEPSEEWTPAPLASPEEITRLRKLASTKKGLAQLRREAIFGTNGSRVPMSGTARRC